MSKLIIVIIDTYHNTLASILNQCYNYKFLILLNKKEACMSKNNVVWGRGVYTLGTIFLNKVLENMRKYSSETVQFGETGIGKQPNYQIELNNKKIALNGQNHEEHSKDQFDEEKISVSFSRADILEAINVAKILEKNS